jgi:hypothetical protein
LRAACATVKPAVPVWKFPRLLHERSDASSDCDTIAYRPLRRCDCRACCPLLTLHRVRHPRRTISIRRWRVGVVARLESFLSRGVAPPQAIRNIKSPGRLACGAPNRSYIMKRIGATAALVLLSSTVALAQTTPTTGGMTPNTGGVANPSTPSTSAPAPSNSATVGQPPTANPSNSQDLSNRSNPQDLSKSGASNPQDLSRPAK